jgi:hypothetical protein
MITYAECKQGEDNTIKHANNPNGVEDALHGFGVCLTRNGSILKVFRLKKIKNKNARKQEGEERGRLTQCSTTATAGEQ